MDKENAARLIRDLFEKSFSKEKFIYFIKNLLNHIEEASFVYRGNSIPGIFQDDVKTIERIGKYEDIDGKKIDILIVTLDRETTLERARSLQRNIIAWYLNGSRGGQMKDAALVAFLSPNNPDWRFSFVKMDYKFEKTDKGKIKVKEQYTPAKRFSFLVGPHEASHTAQSRMLPVILNDSINPTLEEIENIFSVEKVTKEFFEQYKKLFLNLVDEFTINKEFENRVVKEHGIQVADFVKKLMGQIVFLYFLQKKGWLGVKSGERWGMGDKRFMHNLFDRQYCEYENYFNDVLEPLFYDTLNKRDRGNSAVTNDQSYSPHFKCRIPYLNGGLFTPVYDWQKTKIYIDNKYFHDIFEVFDTFNFTVFESDPIEKEVAVDPEMLGQVFENLLEVRDRKSKGTYYTPREIVHYMCQESLINYLISQSGFPEKRIRDLMMVKDQEIAQTEKKKEIIENNPDLKEIAIKVNLLLKAVKVCDPAVGSGAFPMGLLKEISMTRFFLNKHFLKEKNKYGNLLTEYDIKKETLENCIYGVDIDPGAVEIARLRFWLSLVVEHEIEDIEPLPNLDYKIMQGNSLIEDLVIGDSVIKLNFDSSKKTDGRTREMKNLFDEDTQFKLFLESSDKLVDQLEQYHSNFFKETDPEKKKILKNKIDDVEDDLIVSKCEEEILKLNNIIKNSQDDTKIDNIRKRIKEIEKTLNKWKKDHIRPFFPWRLHFGEVFAKGGFDIVIANPPYIDSEGMVNLGLEEQRKYIMKNYKLTRGNWDIYIAFFELGFNKINEKGILTYITPDKWISKPFGEELRKNKYKNLYSILKAGRNIFENAKVDSIVSIFQGKELNTFKVFLLKNTSLLFIRNFEKDDLRPPYSFDYVFSNYLRFLEKIDIISNNNHKLNCENACATSDAYNLAPLIQELREQKFNSVEYLKIINTGTIGKWYSKWGNREMTYLGKKYRFPVINRTQFQKHFNNSYYKKSIKPKLILKGLNLLDVCLDQRGEMIPGKSTLIITNEDNRKLKLYMALLNSSITIFYIKEKYPASSYNQGTTFTKDMINNFPIPKLTEGQVDGIVTIVDKILTLTKTTNYLSNLINQTQVKEYEKQIDQMVYKLYGLTEGEIKIVEER